MRNHALKIDRLSVGYGRGTVVKDLTLRALEPGTVTALVGPNAAGKSTLLRALAGLLRSDGEVHLGGLDLGALDLAERARHVAFMPQAMPAGISLSVMEAVVTSLRATPAFEDRMSGAKAHRRALAVLSRFGILDLAMEPLDRLSGGQRQLASLAQAAVREPALLLLDEPTSALDPRHQLRVMGVVRDMAREGRVVVVVLHDLSLAAQFADRLVVLSDGTLAAEGPCDRTLTPEMLRQVYGVEARVERCSRGRMQVMIDAEIAETAQETP